MGLVVGHLNLPPAVRLGNRRRHGGRDRVGVHNDRPLHMSRCPANGLDKRSGGAQESLLIGVQDGHQGDLRQVQPLPQEVDAHHDVVYPQPEVAEDLHPFDRFDLGVQVVGLDSHLPEVIRQVFRHTFGERRHQGTLALGHPPADLLQEVIDLPLRRSHLHPGVHQPGRADDLLHHLFGVLQFVGAGRGRETDDLADTLLKFLKGQGTVVQRRGQAKAVLDQCLLARAVAVVHSVQLGDGDVRFVNEEEKVVGEVIQERPGGLAGLAHGEVAGIVLDAGTVARLAHHLDVVAGALFQPLGLQEFSLLTQLLQTLLQFLLDGAKSRLQLLPAGDKVAGREDAHFLRFVKDFPSQGVDLGQALDLVAPELDAEGRIAVGRENVHRIAAHPEGAPAKVQVVAVVVDGGQVAEEAVAPAEFPSAHHDHIPAVLLRRADGVDAGDAGDDDDISAGEEGLGGGQAEFLDLGVDVGILLDVEVLGRHIGLRLVIVVITDKVLHGVLGEEFPKFAI